VPSAIGAGSIEGKSYMGDGSGGGLEGDLEISVDELALLKQPLDMPLAVIIQNFISRVIFIGRIGVFRRNEFDERGNEGISFRQDILVQNNTMFAR
jgi:hypothetical protein